MSATQPARPRRRRLGAAAGLFILAPLIGEFLLGNLSITWLWVLPVLAPLYGGGALLIRETARRWRLGWPGMVGFGLGYAVIEEALVTYSLFNPNYVGLRLLDYGYVPALGIGAWWTVFVLGLHTVWSTAVPIALVEATTGDERDVPWLGRAGLVVTAVLFALGCLAANAFDEDPFVASGRQLVASVFVVAVILTIAFVAGRIGKTRNAAGAPPTPRRTALATFAIGSAFMLLGLLHQLLPPAIDVAAMLGLLIGLAALLWRWSARVGWSAMHAWAAAAGLTCVYIWYGFAQPPSVGGVSPLVDAAGNALFAAGAVAVLALARRRAAGTG